MPRLEIRKLSGVRSQVLDDRPLTIGRSSKNDLALRHNTVSRRHAVVERVNGELVLRDLESHVGTKVNDERVTERTLRHDDRIMIGPYELIVVDEALEGGIGCPDGSPSASAAVAEQLQAAEARINALTAERDVLLARLEEHDAAADEMRREVESLRQAVEESNHQQLAEREKQSQALMEADDRLTSLERQLSEAQAAVAAEHHAAAEAAAQGQAAAQALQLSLQQARLEVEQLQNARAELLVQLREHEHARRSASERASQSQQAWQSLRTQMSSLDQLAQQLSSVQRQLSQAESQWVDAEQKVGSSGEGAAEARQRQHQLTVRLDTLSRERDQTLDQLCTRLHDAADRAGAQPPEGGAHHANGNGATPKRTGLLSMLRRRRTPERHEA